MLWASLADQRPGRELHWLAQMPGTEVTALGNPLPYGQERWMPMRYRRPVRRFVEAGAFAWMRGLDDLDLETDWIASLELCSLVTGQASTWARRRKVRQAVLTWENDPRQPLYRLPPYRGALRRAREADLFLCFIQAAREHLLSLDVPDERIRVVLPGVDTALFSPAPEPQPRPELVFVSPVAANKGIDRVLEAFDLVRRQVPDAHLTVMGRGPLVPLVQTWSARTAGAVTYVGAGAPRDVAARLRSSAVFVTAPRATWRWNEQFGLAYLEAMSSGLPVVTTRCGTNHEAVPPPNPMVADDAEELADALVGLLDDPSRRAVLGAANRAHVLAHHELGEQTRLMGEAFAGFERQ
ncbi:MAG: glycosyltransferase family 4 protein [Sporichthyaceae bacterium]